MGNTLEHEEPNIALPTDLLHHYSIGIYAVMCLSIDGECQVGHFYANTGVPGKEAQGDGMGLFQCYDHKLNLAIGERVRSHCVPDMSRSGSMS